MVKAGWLLNASLLFCVLLRDQPSRCYPQPTQTANSQLNIGGTTTFDIGNDFNGKGVVFNTGKVQGIIRGEVTIIAIDPYEDYLKTFEGRLAKSTAEGLMLEIEGFAVAKLLQPLMKAGSKAYSASRKWKSSEVALATGIEKNVKSLSSSELKLLDDYLLGKKIPPITYADRARQSNANLSKVLNDLGKTSAAQTKLEKQVALQNMSDLLNVRQRSLALAPEPSQAKINMAEGIGAARYEQATGRTVTRSTDPAVDFIDPKIGAFDLKGPIRSKTGAKIPITPKMRADFAKSVIKEANVSTASKAVVVDTLGLSKSEVQSLKSTINNGVKTKKPIIYLE